MLNKISLILSFSLFMPFTLMAARFRIPIPVPAGAGGIVVIVLIVIVNIALRAAQSSESSPGYSKNPQVITRKIGGGEFHCPKCNDKALYNVKQVSGPGVRVPSEFVECRTCKSTYKKEIVGYSEKMAKEQDEVLSIFQEAIRKIMIKMMLADGKIDQAEKEKIIEIYEKVSKSEYTMETLDGDIEKIEKEDRSVLNYVLEVSEKISTTAKGMLLFCAIEICVSDGVIQKEERKMLNDIAEELEIPQSVLEGLIKKVGENTPFTEEDFKEE